MRLALVIGSMGVILAGNIYSAEKPFKPSATLEIKKAYRNSLQDSSRAGKLPQAVAKNLYIVELNDPAAASYTGNIQGLAATSPSSTGAQRLDIQSQASVAYSQMLQHKQDALLQRCNESLGRPITVSKRYQHSLNGFAAQLTGEEAQWLAQLPEVKSVSKDHLRQPLTDVGPQWIGADALWHADETAWPPQIASKGEGTVIAIIDSGINNTHPAFADISEDGYDHSNPLGSGRYLPGSYCDSVDPEFCNDKLIGAWSFTSITTDPNTPLDDEGHGSHTASIAAGNGLDSATIEAPTASLSRSISGVAPRANLIVYDTCFAGGCLTSSILAAIEQMVIDASNLPNGIDAVNFSIGVSGSPYTDPVARSFLNATAAGIYVSASAGNSGPGAATLFNPAPWIATVAATTHNRTLSNNLVGISSDNGAFGDIPAVGFSDGYGPAPLIYAGDYPTDNGSSNDTLPGQCLTPFPAGHFQGEIVICDRGSVARVAKGANVLAGGAGGFVLANTAEAGESVSSDAHVLPGVHIGFEDAVSLKAWLAQQANATATINGMALKEDPQDGDIMADFSSRGPLPGFDLLKPDIAAPGASILAAVIGTGEQQATEVYEFRSGTSMSAPHHAGAAALLSSIRPSWTPYEIKSALMMSAANGALLKEDAFSPTDAFDVGAGRTDLSRIQYVDLVLNESPQNFLDSDPAAGGDPAGLNLASMQASQCLEECTWRRRLKNAGEHYSIYELRPRAPEGIKLRVSPRFIKLHPGEEAEITVKANAAFAAPTWQFASLDLLPLGFRHKKPDLHIPISLQPATTSDSDLINVSVDKNSARKGDILNYEIKINNRQSQGDIALTTELPRGLKILKNSLQQEVSNGTSSENFAYGKRTLTWAGELQTEDIAVIAAAAPNSDQGYVSLDTITEPFGCPEDCDEGAFILNVPEFTYNGKPYSQVIWSVNGTLEAGTESNRAASFFPARLPSTRTPNNLIAPFWADLNLELEGAQWYAAVVTNDTDSFIVFEWQNVPLVYATDSRFNFQVWIQVGDSGNIWYVYGEMADTTGAFVSIGAENDTGEKGYTRFFTGDGLPPVQGEDLQVVAVSGGSATLRFQAKLKSCRNRERGAVVRTRVDTATGDDTAIAATRCTD